MNECEEQIDKEYNELQKGNLICAHNNYKNKGKLNDSESSKIIRMKTIYFILVVKAQKKKYQKRKGNTFRHEENKSNF